MFAKTCGVNDPNKLVLVLEGAMVRNCQLAAASVAPWVETRPPNVAVTAESGGRAAAGVKVKVFPPLLLAMEPATGVVLAVTDIV